ncbi:MAG: M15 family metallopeptidase [Actinomycetota bacterium]
MIGVRRLSGRAASALVGAIVGAVLVLGVDGLTRGPDPRPGLESPRPEPQSRARGATDLAPANTFLLAWSPTGDGGLPPETERVVERVKGVRAATTVQAGLDWIESSRGPDGATADSPPDGFSIPFEIALVEPDEYARFVPPGDRDPVLALGRGEILLAETSARLRDGEEGTEIEFPDRSATVAGVVSDIAANGYEALMTGTPPASWERIDRFLLVEMNRPRSAAVERRIRGLLRPEQVLRVRAHEETPFLRYGDAVLPQMLLKRTFGEFAARPRPDGFFDVDPAWRAAHIRSAHVPVLGEITCHRALFPQLRAALKDVVQNGLSFAIDPGDFGGCFSPRFINADPEGRVSHHAWGIAVDFNVSENTPGSRPNLDRRLVDVFENWGFTWGGRWLKPDGMHFEWVSFP